MTRLTTNNKKKTRKKLILPMVDPLFHYTAKNAKMQKSKKCKKCKKIPPAGVEPAALWLHSFLELKATRSTN